MDTQMMVSKVPPNAMLRKFPSIIPDDCFVFGVQNSVLSGVAFVVCCRSATNLFMAFRRALSSSTDSFDRSS